MKWILIAFIAAGSGSASVGGPVVAEFETIYACQHAVDVIQIMQGEGYSRDIEKPYEERWVGKSWARCIPSK